MHSGHRQRMREKMMSSENFPPHELLEMILSFAIPRKNTNDIAHRLLERFGTLEGVLRAPYTELISVRGMGVHSAFLMRLFFLVFRSLEKSREIRDTEFDTHEKIVQYSESLFRGMQCEAVYALLLDSSLKFVDCVRLAGGSASSATVGFDSIARCPALSRSTSAVIIHNHPSGMLEETEEDRDFISRITEIFALSDVEIVDQIVVCGTVGDEE